MGKKQTATTGGVAQPPNTGPLKCGDVQVYSKMQDRPTNRQQRDHVPATNSMLKAGESFHTGLTGDQITCFNRYVRSDALTIAIPKSIHRQHSRTCSNRGGNTRRDTDAGNLTKAANDDMDEVKPKLSADCQAKYEAARAKILAQLPTKFFNECKAKALKNC
jgi:hypothetical protein